MVANNASSVELMQRLCLLRAVQVPALPLGEHVNLLSCYQHCHVLLHPACACALWVQDKCSLFHDDQNDKIRLPQVGSIMYTSVERHVAKRMQDAVLQEWRAAADACWLHPSQRQARAAPTSM